MKIKQVFLSHATADKDAYVLPFAKRLANEDITYWLDVAEIKWGDKIGKKINEGLKQSLFVIVFVSESFIRRNWTETELSAALNRENDEGRVVVLPIIIGDSKKVLANYPLLLDKSYLRWDFGLDTLVMELKRLLAVPHRSLENSNAFRNRSDEKQSLLRDRESASPKANKVRTNPIDGLPYVWISSGSFEMGCSQGDNDCEDHEKPRHIVQISRGFWIGQTPVTVAAYNRFVNATGHRIPPNPKFQQTEDDPVVNVNWDDAKRYCKWAGGRLPTEAEWEFAARAGSKSARYGDLVEVAWCEKGFWTSLIADIAAKGTHPVAKKKPNSWGLYDTLGNVSQWCSDWYDENYYKNSPKIDPTGPEQGLYRILRGGSWIGLPSDVRVSNRMKTTPHNRDANDGFRCVLDY